MLVSSLGSLLKMCGAQRVSQSFELLGFAMQFILGLLLALGLVAAAFAQEVEEGVLVLTDANFDAVSASPLWTVPFRRVAFSPHQTITKICI